MTPSQIIEEHPFPPVCPPNATIMMSGTLPPRPEKWCMPFHYPNFSNDMWRIYGLVFFNDAQYFQVTGERRFDAARIRAFLYQYGIALVPVVKRAIREHGNAADKFLTIIETVNLAEILPQLPQCQWIMTTGGKATEIMLELSGHSGKAPKTNEYIELNINGRMLTLYRLPSTSRAYPLALIKKADAYRSFFRCAGLI